jgi:cytochrome b6-f complex iron-sulfur subunit
MASLSRRQFNALVAASAAATLVPGCGSSIDGSVTPVDGQAVLAFAKFPSLRAPGGSALVDVRGQAPIMVVRVDAMSAVALSATCTHAGCLLRYELAPQDLHCDCHRADFALDGAVLRGPTSVPLPTYDAAVGADGITVSVS